MRLFRDGGENTRFGPQHFRATACKHKSSGNLGITPTRTIPDAGSSHWRDARVGSQLGTGPWPSRTTSMSSRPARKTVDGSGQSGPPSTTTSTSA